MGNVRKPGSSLSDTYIAKVSVSGLLQWIKTYGFAADSFNGNKFVVTADGGFLICSETYTATDDIHLMKLDG